MTTLARKIISLNGDDWKLGGVPLGNDPWLADPREIGAIGQWHQATVPGNIRLDLMRAGIIEDPFYGLNNQASQWVDTCNWWYLKDFPLEIAPGERAHLVLHGVDYVSWVYFNGHPLGQHEGMFSPQVYEITPFLKAQNHLDVRILGSDALRGPRPTLGQRWRLWLEQRFSEPVRRYPGRLHTVKCQMSFGWDFAPPLRTMGIWDDAEVIISGPVFIRHLFARPVVHDDNQAAVHVSLTLDAATETPAEVAFTLAGLTFEHQPRTHRHTVALAPGVQELDFTLNVPHPRLWWSWDRGRPDLYLLTAEVRVAGQVSDVVSERVGLRTVTMSPNPGAPSDAAPWTFTINGQTVFARGANWVPVDSLPGRATVDDYRKLLDLARQANMNMLRVWGGGLREKRAFYDLCDELGIMVWQEFPFACAFFTQYPADEDFLRLAAAESRAIVETLRNHPSVVFWCGGNEFAPQRHRPLLDALARVTNEADGSRPFHPVSPSFGDSHFWAVWHGQAHFSEYTRDQALLASEFGLQAPPAVESLRNFIPPRQLWPPGQAWTYHHAEWGKLRRYAAIFNPADDLDSFVAASQRAQAWGLKVAIEHHRRRKYHCSGVLVWQFNEPWPAICWSLVDYYRQPKPAYEVIQQLYNPLLVSLAYPLVLYRAGGTFDAEVWLINDWPRPLPGCRVEIELHGAEGVCQRWETEMDVPADSAQIIGHLVWKLPGGTCWQVQVRVVQQGRVISTNSYDLTAYDPHPTPRSGRFWAWVASKLMGA
ncbi:MAG: hypothetical protein NUW24_08625 [Anaerolineae bacterium]|nr:hypothetical protein [Anaerolineae bacterium]